MIPFACKKKLAFLFSMTALTIAFSSPVIANDSVEDMINSNRLHLPVGGSSGGGQALSKIPNALEAPGIPTEAINQALQIATQQASSQTNSSTANRGGLRPESRSSAKEGGRPPNQGGNADQLLIQGLVDGSFNNSDQVIRNQFGDGLSPEDIQMLREVFLEYEAAKNNPNPPPTRSAIKQLSPGDTFDLVAMSDFPSTLMIADQFGEPLKINYHDLGAGSVVEVREMRSQNKDGGDFVDGLRIHALKPMRSTSLTIRVEGSRLPINVTIRTIPADSKTPVNILNELRLSWVNKLSQVAVSAGRYASPDITKRGDKLMMDVVTGTLLSNEAEGIHKVPLEGEINSALFVDEATGFWYLRLPITATPQNVAIESQALSSVNGYRVVRMKSVPPRVIGVTANGRSYRLVMHLDRRLSHVQ